MFAHARSQPGRASVPRRRLATSILAAAFVTAACGGQETASGDGSAAASGVFGAPPDSSHPTPKTTASASPVAPGDNQSGRILLLRFSETSPAEYFVVNADGSDEQPFGPRVEYEARQVAPDESLLSIVGPNSEGMIVGGTIGLDGTGFRLFRNPKPSLNLACGIWGPHARMACEAWSDADPSLNGIRTVLASDGRDPQRLTTGRDVPCDYSPDGSQLAFVRESPHGDGSMLMVMAADGGVPEALLENVATSGLPCDWAPDGSSILTATTDGKLHVVTTKGDSATFVGDGLDGYISNGVWSSDGARVLLTMAPQGEQGDVYTVAADGSDLRRITHSELLEEGIIWLP